MKRHKSIGPVLRDGELKFWTSVNFEVEYFLNDETEGVLTDTVIYLSDQHLTWLSQLKPNAKVGTGLAPLSVFVLIHCRLTQVISCLTRCTLSAIYPTCRWEHFPPLHVRRDI